MPARSSRKSQKRTSVPSPGEYAAFISQIELVAVWLHQARVENHIGPEQPEQLNISVQSRARWDSTSDGFVSYHEYAVRLDHGENPAAVFDVTFAARYTSVMSMTDEIFNVFQHTSLPLNTWPYLREFVASMLGRMNWLPFAIPALKLGVPSGEDDIEPASSAHPHANRDSPRAPGS
jgi:hypothetical protein